MKSYILVSALLLTAPGLALAQSYQQTNYGPSAGDRELTLSGSGASDGSHVDEGSFGLSGELGWYLSEHTEVGIQQSLNWASVRHGDDSWNGATGGFIDYHFGNSRLRPYLGASLGYIYGDGVNESFYAGAGGGLKYYVLPNTFIKGGAEWQFLFDDVDDADDAFDDGRFVYSVGIGYNF